jgi:hypothetical protein
VEYYTFQLEEDERETKKEKLVGFLASVSMACVPSIKKTWHVYQKSRVRSIHQSVGAICTSPLEVFEHDQHVSGIM